MKHVFDIRSLGIENAISFQMHSVQEPQPTQVSTKKREPEIQNDTPQAELTSLLKIAYSTTSLAKATAAPLAAPPSLKFSLNQRHSQHARQRSTTEEGFTSVTLVAANVLFPTHVVLTVHRSIQAAAVHMDSMPTYTQRMMHHPKTKLMKQQLQEARRRVKNHIMHCVFIIVILYVHQLT